jgi:AcrR family transcriptional regulator
MYALCSTEKTAQQQHKFEQTFLQMMLELHYDDITISELCRRAGLTRKMFYRLFQKKSDVLYSLIDRTLMECDSYVPDESVGPGELHQFLAFWQYKKDLLDALQKHQISSLLTDRAIRFAMRETGSPVRAFGAEEIKGSYESIVFYMTGLFSLLLLWHSQGFPSSIDEMARVMMDLLTTPACTNTPC